MTLFRDPRVWLVALAWLIWPLPFAVVLAAAALIVLIPQK